MIDLKKSKLILSLQTMFVIFALVFLYMTLIYWFDKLIITNQR